MTTQAINFADLMKGNPIGQVTQSLQLVKKSVVQELMDEFGQDSLDGLAAALSIGR